MSFLVQVKMSKKHLIVMIFLIYYVPHKTMPDDCIYHYCSFVYKGVCIDNKFSKPVVIYRGKSAVYKFIEVIIKGRSYCKK